VTFHCAAQPPNPPLGPLIVKLATDAITRSFNFQRNQLKVIEDGAVSSTSDAPRSESQAVDSLGHKTQGESGCWVGVALPASQRNPNLFLV